MKSKSTTLISFLVLFGLLSLILFLTIPDSRLDSAVFWIAFAFTIPINFLALCGFTVLSYSGKDAGLEKGAVLSFISFGFGALLLLSGIIFMYFPIEGTVFPIIVYAIITAAYIIITLLATSGTKHIKNATTLPMYNKLLEVDVLDCAEKAANPEVKAKLRAFAENIHFSDPTSHPSLAGMESALQNAVFEISSILSADPGADVSEKIRIAEGMLVSINNRRLVLKQCSK